MRPSPYGTGESHAGAVGSKVGYWSTTGAVKTFGHPLEPSWLIRVDRAASVIDYGCGYGRLVGSLIEQGFTHVEGIDSALGMIARARSEQPDARFAVLRQPPVMERPDGSLDIVLLFAVLTCIPDGGEQRALVAELTRVLKAGGLLYVSDLCLQDDERNRARYRRSAERHRVYGVFDTDDGAVCRHHTAEWLQDLFGGFDTMTRREIDVATMNGHPSRATQLLLVRR